MIIMMKRVMYQSSIIEEEVMMDINHLLIGYVLVLELRSMYTQMTLVILITRHMIYLVLCLSQIPPFVMQRYC